jgi:hypothetical protein
VTELSFPRGGQGQNHGITIRLRCESVRGVKACGVWKHDLLFESSVDDGGSETGGRKQCADAPAGPRTQARPFHFNNNFTLIFAKDYDENARCADCDTHGTLCSSVDASALQTATARPVEPLGSSTFSLAAGG